MKKRINKQKHLDISHRNIIIKGLITILIYFFVSILWILYSNFIVDQLFVNKAIISKIQSIKGLAFVLMTTAFMWIIVQRYNHIVIQLNQAYIESEVKVKELIVDNKRNKLYHMLTKYLTDEYDTSESIVIDVFHYIFDKIDVCDQGSVLKIDNDVVTFVDVIGYDMDLLNKLRMPADKFELYTIGIHRNKMAEKGMLRKLGTDNYQIYHDANPEIYESIYIGLMDTKEKRLGISLDVSMDKYNAERLTFSNQIVKEMKELQFLITAMFKIKSLVGMKKILQNDIVSSFISALEYHDEYTKGHSEEVARISVLIGKELEFSDELLNTLHWAATIHDLGKIVIPREILNKKTALTEEEYNLVKQHPENGQRFLSNSESLREISTLVRFHHEWYNGGGYPDGIAGEEIPLLSRIICVADSYHAMTSDRPYRKGLSTQKALQELINNEGTQFCPVVVEAFLRISDKIS